MKNIIITLALISGIVNIVNAQKDSLIFQHAVDSVSKKELSTGKKYRYFDIKMKEETRLIKLSVLEFYNFSNKNYFNLELSYEKKIGKMFSINITSKNQYYEAEDILEVQIANTLFNSNTGRYETTYSTLILSDWETYDKFKSICHISLRYYPLKKIMIDYKNSGNNVNGLYTGIGIYGLLRYENRYLDVAYERTQDQAIYPLYLTSKISKNRIESDFLPGFMIGYQQRLGKLFFVDFGLTITLHHDYSIMSTGIGVAYSF